jgi:hypothetical protein
MPFSFELDIDRIARDVLNDVCSRESRISARPQSVPETDADQTFRSLRVISLENIRHLDASKKQILISPQSVLTPSAKEELQNRHIEIIRRKPESVIPQADKEWWGVFPAAAVSDGLKNRIEKLLHCPPVIFGTLPEMLSVAEKRWETTARRGAVITSAPASAMYATCRSAVLRPVFGIDEQQMMEDAAEMQANFIILASRAAPAVQKTGLLKTFLFRLSADSAGSVSKQINV